MRVCIRVIGNEMNFLPEREPSTLKANDYNRNHDTRICVSIIAFKLSTRVKSEQLVRVILDTLVYLLDAEKVSYS